MSIDSSRLKQASGTTHEQKRTRPDMRLNLRSEIEQQRQSDSVIEALEAGAVGGGSNEYAHNNVWEFSSHRQTQSTTTDPCGQLPGLDKMIAPIGPPEMTVPPTWYCSPILMNALLPLGCRFSNQPNTWANENDQSALGDHFFKETLRLFYRETNHHTLTPIRASGSMSLRDASCGRDSENWCYAGRNRHARCHLLRLPINDEVTEVKEHSKIDEWYVEASTPADEQARLRQELKDAQNEIDQLKETVEGLKGVIREQKTEIGRRRQNETMLQARRIGKEPGGATEKDAPEALVRDRTLLVQHVLETVVGRLDRIDNATSGNRVFDEIDGFLENVTGHIMGCIQQVMQDASAVNGVVRNMRRLLPGRADKIDLEDVRRLSGEVNTFKASVNELLEGIKQELVGAGGGEAIQNDTKQKEPTRDRPLWLGFRPARWMSILEGAETEELLQHRVLAGGP
ncbi:hypothetical protein JX266_013922 [Neoarthrinium moseri]|nr:hypothetical protein JX266_013922 [Neoarthrinium moseri]